MQLPDLAAAGIKVTRVLLSVNFRKLVQLVQSC